MGSRAAGVREGAWHRGLGQGHLPMGTDRFPHSSNQYTHECVPAKDESWGFPGGAVVKNPPANAGDTGSSPGLGRPHMPRSN